MAAAAWHTIRDAARSAATMVRDAVWILGALGGIWRRHWHPEQP